MRSTLLTHLLIVFAFGILTPDAKPAKSTSSKSITSTGTGTSRAQAHVGLDTAAIHTAYLDGEFDQVTRPLEAYWSGQTVKSRADSLFIFRYLGVVYGANESTQSRGQEFLNLLVATDPAADIGEMYVSDGINQMFRNAVKQYRASHPQPPAPVLAALDTTPTPAPSTPSPQPSLFRRREVLWVTGGVVLAAGAAGLLYMEMGERESRGTTTVITE